MCYVARRVHNVGADNNVWEEMGEQYVVFIKILFSFLFFVKSLAVCNAIYLAPSTHYCPEQVKLFYFMECQ